MAQWRLLERDDLLGALGARLEQARSGIGSMVLLAGEAGSGKTSLTRAFVEEVGQRSLTLLGACDPLSTPRPLSPLLDYAADEDSGLGGLFDEEPDNIEIFNRVLGRVRHTIRPILMVVEDIHWADQATLDFLRFIGRRIADSKAVVICTYRDDEISQDHSLRPVLGQLSPLESTYRLVVPPLSREAVATLAAGTQVNTAEIYRITGGNAFYVTEILAGGERIPSTVQDAVIARVSRLEKRPLGVVQAVSIAPRSLSVEHAMHLMGATAEEVDRAIASGVVIGEGSSLRFRHELARSAVESSIPPATRHSLHSRMIALLLEDDPPDHARIAHHALEADAPELVVEYAPIAAEAAAAQGSHKEAIEFYEAALSKSEKMDREDEMALRLKLAAELGIVDRQEEALAQTTRAVEHFRVSEQPVELADALIKQSNALWRVTKTTAAKDAIQEALGLLEAGGPSRELANALYSAAYQHMLARRADDAIVAVERALEMARQVNDDVTLWNAEMIRGTIEIVLGRPRAAAQMLKRSLAHARAAGDREGISVALGMLGSGGGEARIYDEAIPALEEAVAWGRSNDADYNVAYSRSWLARIAFEQGRWDDATSIADLVDETSLNREGIAIVTSLGAKGRVQVRRGEQEGAKTLKTVIGFGQRHELQHLWSPICGLAEYHWLRGETDQMRPILDDAYRRALDTDSEWARGEVGFWMWKAGVIDQPPPGAAEPFALHIAGRSDEAAEAWREIGCPYEVALALLDGDGESVLEAVGVFDSLGARPAADMARSRLRGLGVDRVPRGPTEATRGNPAGLTGRQLEVLELMTTGLSNSEIANKLFVSKKTIEHHVSAIYSKLGVATRAQAIAEASQLGIP